MQLNPHEKNKHEKYVFKLTGENGLSGWDIFWSENFAIFNKIFY